MHIFAIIASILLLAALVGFVYYCIKGGNLIIDYLLLLYFGY